MTVRELIAILEDHDMDTPVAIVDANTNHALAGIEVRVEQASDHGDPFIGLSADYSGEQWGVVL